VDTLNNETFPYYLGRLEAIAQKNNGYLALGRVSQPHPEDVSFDFDFAVDVG
jgi:hypothetical protein